MTDMKAYLAANYMSGPKADAILSRYGDEKLKKKRKKPKNEDYIGGVPSKEAGSSGLMMKDEDEWRSKVKDDNDLDGEDAPLVGKDISTFKKSKSAWSTVGSSGIPLSSSVKIEENAEAGPSNSHNTPDVDNDDNDTPVMPVKKKRAGGLKTAAQLRADLEAEKAAKSPSPEPDESVINRNKTVYRDSSGRILDVDKIKEEERKKEEEEKRKEKEREEWSKGVVQRRQREERQREERAMGEKDVARHANDAAMNRELKEVERWNDPAAAFISKKKIKGKRRPKYQGAYPLNRFNIPPGYRWDGVDRSNGFEKKFFQYQNAAARKELEHNQWSMEDM